MSNLESITIAYEAKRYFSSQTGFGIYNRTLVRNLAVYYSNNRYLLIAPSVDSTDPEVVRNFSFKQVERISLGKSKTVLGRAMRHRRVIRKNCVSIYHGLSQQIPRSIRRSNVRKVITIHDLAYKYFPTNEYTDNDFRRRDKEIIEACSSADRIVAVSQNTKRDLTKWFSIDPDRIDVVYQACDDRYRNVVEENRVLCALRKYGLPDKYWLTVGTMTKRKNLHLVVEAMSKVPDRIRRPLVIIGKETEYTKTVIRLAKSLGIEHLLIFPRNVTNDDLPAVYQGADIFLYVSLYEGFGIPVLEALCSRIPVITSNVSSLPEAGGQESYLISPDDSGAIAAAIEHIEHDKKLRSRMIDSGYIYSQKFLGRVLAEEMMNLYKDVLAT